MNFLKRKRSMMCIKEAKQCSDLKLSLIWLYDNSLQALFQVLFHITAKLLLQLKGADLDFFLHHLPMLALRPT